MSDAGEVEPMLDRSKKLKLPKKSKRLKARSAVQPLAALLVSLFTLTACSPGFQASSEFMSANQTGFTARDGKLHTGASADNELEELKSKLAGQSVDPKALPKADQDLASRILYANIESVGGGKADTSTLRVHISLRETGRIYFDVKASDRISPAAGDASNETRYKFVTGRLASEETVPFEAGVLCRKTTEDCGVATISLREKKKDGARAGLVIRHQDIKVQSKTSTTGATHQILKRLSADLKTAKAGKLQTFEVAWGPSGFSVDIGDSEICPVGRLVETNDLDEPVKLNCPTVPTFRDLEGRMLGNTTRGELFIEITAKVQKLFIEESESVYLLIRQQKAAKPVAGPPPTTTPGQTSPSEVAEDVDDEIFEQEPQEQNEAPVSGTKGWLIPVDPNHKVTKSWARDRKHPVIEAGVKEWLTSTRLKRFAVRFLPNRSLVLGQLSKAQVPNEFAYITLIESTFFTEDGYPVQTSSAAAVGPWQFMPLTGKGNGLAVFPRVKSGTKLNVHPCDERADLEKSSEAAGRYLSSILRMFPNDPKLVLMGYNQGEYGVQRNLNRLKNTTSETRLKVVREVGLNYWAMRKFNMAPNETLRYVEKFVSAYHAALEMEPVAADASIAPWKPKGNCSL